jgi:Cu+-exporting ATPase
MDAPCHGESSLPLNASTIGVALGGALLAGVALLALYFGVLTLVSNWEFAVSQFGEYRGFIIALAVGFGLQAGLFIYLRQAAHAAATGKVFVASGTTSGVAMLSCCTHYLVNLIPVLGATGLMTLVSEYQVQLLWVGVVSNVAGIGFMVRRLVAFAQGG